MSSFLTKRKSKESYEQRKAQNQSRHRDVGLYAMKNFEQFVSTTYEKTTDAMIEKL